ncbi:MAG: cob(I)yrinic acid a,c-diamide adenosyltransferase [Gammaproteobacteria bacterium]|nr:cob(I)yrinic acid a,c-diamide adenosyltransferase [Gammaproteobacteria bacterium]
MLNPSQSDSDINSRHNNRMIRKKNIVDEKIAKADRDKGLILVHTGNGKGKSSAAFGMVARTLGHGLRVAIVQFIKGNYSTGEQAFFENLPNVEYHVMGDGFTWETQNRDQDILTAQKAWDKACTFLTDENIHLVLLDELNIVLKHNYLSIDNVISTLEQKPEMQHVIVTGRGAKPQLIEIADTVTDMQVIKHAFKAGIRAQKGIEL